MIVISVFNIFKQNTNKKIDLFKTNFKLIEEC